MRPQEHDADERSHACSTHHETSQDGDDELGSDVSSDDGLTPLHPVPALQEAFEESIIEAAEDVQYESGPPASTHPSPESRRHELLRREIFDDSWNTRWRQKPSAKCHPLTKLVAQIVFGMHLLHGHQAKSDAEVVKILQAHVDDIDSFLEKTGEDFDLAIRDIEERNVFLQLPMTHLDVFDIMLDDRTFRTQLVEGNEKIEKIITRSAKGMNAALSDVQKGLDATEQLAKYLHSVEGDWPEDYPELPAILVAMRGNQEGWSACLHELQMKGNTLGVSLVQLGATIGEMSKLAAAASRRNTTASQEVNPAPRSRYTSGTSHLRHSRRISQLSMDKPLPEEPDTLQPAVQATLPRRWSRRQSSAEGTKRMSTAQKHGNLQPRDAHHPRHSDTTVLADIRRSSHPVEPNSSRARQSVIHESSRTVHDSAYSSGSDPAAERRMRKGVNTPASIDLFPNSKPATPESSLRASRSKADTHMSENKHTPSQSPLDEKQSHFSIRRIFHRRSRIRDIA